MQELPKTIKDLARKYNVSVENLYYKSAKKKYSLNKIKKDIFEAKYGTGDSYQNYYNYYMPRILEAKKLTEIKKEFFTNYKLSELTYIQAENIWEKIMRFRLR